MSVIKVCSNEKGTPFPGGDNFEIEKIHWQNYLKSSPPEPQGKFHLNLTQGILG